MPAMVFYASFLYFYGGMRMIITQKKPVEELLAMLGDVKKVAIVGCANCAAACQTGGEKEIQEMKTLLEEQGMEVVATVLPEECCHKMLVKKETKILRDCGAEAVVGMACGDGVQTIADNVQLPVYPSNNTMFLGQIERVGMFHEYCRMCGDCVLGTTGGICPITKCAKSLVNGPCGGQKMESARLIRRMIAPGSRSITAWLLSARRIGWARPVRTKIMGMSTIPDILI